MRKLLLSALLLMLTGCSMKTGDEAVALMSHEQRQTMDTLLTFSSTTSRETINTIFGPPVKDEINPTWEVVQQGKTSYIRAYFIGSELRKIIYMSLRPMWGYSIYYNAQGVYATGR